MATIASMIFSIEAQTSSIEASMKQVADVVDNASSSMVGTIAKSIALGDALEKMGELGLEAIEKNAEAFPELVARTIEVGNGLYEMSLKTGASVENLSALRYVAGQTGIDFESFGTTLYKMEQALGSTGAKADATGKTLSTLGLDMQTLKDEKPDQAFIDIMSALEDMPNRADQAAAGMKIFGKGFKDMAGLAQESITDLIQEASDLGLVMDTTQAAAAHAAEVGWKSFTMQLEAVGMKIGAVVMPALVAVEQTLSGAFRQAIADTQVPLVNVMSIVTGLVDGLFGLAEAGVSAGKYLSDGFYLLRGVLFGVLESVTNIIATFLRGNASIAEFAASIPVMGNAWKGVAIDARAAADMVGSIATSFQTTKNDAFDAMGKTDQAFDAANTSIETMRVSVQQNLPAAYAKASATIDDYAERSKNAFGGAGNDVDGATKKLTTFQKALLDLNSVGETWQQTIDGINGETVNAVEYYLHLGVSATVLKDAYELTDAQIKVLQATYLGYGNVLDTIEAKEHARVDYNLSNLSKIGEATTQQLKKAETDTQESVLRTQDIWNEYYAIQASMSGTATDGKIANVQRWMDDEVSKLKADDLNWMNHYAAIYAVAQAKMAQILALNDPLYRSYQTLQTDIETGWSNTFESTLAKTGDFTQAAQGVLQQFEDDFKNIGASIVTDLIKTLFQPLLDAAKGYMQQVEVAMINGLTGGSSSGSGGGGGFGGVSSLFSGGGGSTDTFSANVTDTDTGDVSHFGDAASAGGHSAGSMMAGAGMAVGGISTMAQNKGMGSDVLGGVETGAGIGTMIMPGIGTAIGAAAGAIVGLIEGMSGVSASVKAARDAQDQFVAALNSTATASQKAEMAAATGSAAYKTIAVIGRDAFLQVGDSADKAEQYVKMLLNTDDTARFKLANDALKQTLAIEANVKTGVSGLQTAFSQAGEYIPASMRNAISTMAKLPGLTNDERDALNNLVSSATPSYAQLTSLASKYGLSVDQLGTKVQQLGTEDGAKSLVSDFTELTDAGVDANTVVGGMKSKIDDVVNSSEKFGTKVPESMKPMIEDLLAMGGDSGLLDKNGQKITDISQIQFEATPLDQGITKLNLAIDHLASVLDKVPGQLKTINDTALNPKTIDIRSPFGMTLTVPNPAYTPPPGAATGGMVTDAGIQHFAGGGTVLPFLTRGPDTVPAMLAPGELVLNDNQQQAVGALLKRGGAAPSGASGDRQTNEAILAELKNLTSRLMTLPAAIARSSRDAALIAAA